MQPLQRGELPDLRRQARQQIVVEVQLLQRRELPDLRRQCRQLIEAEVQHPQRTQMPNLRRHRSCQAHPRQLELHHSAVNHRHPGPTLRPDVHPPLLLERRPCLTQHAQHEDVVAHVPRWIRRPRKVELVASPLENLEVPLHAGVLAEAIPVHPYELQRPLLIQGPHTIIAQETNEVVDEVALHTLEVESRRQSPEQGKTLLERPAQRQYVMCFDVLDVGKDERLELDGEVANVSV